MLIQRTEAVDAAQQLSLGKTIAEIATLHGRLTQDVQKHRVDLTHVISEAQSIADDASSAKAALRKISTASKGS